MDAARRKSIENKGRDKSPINRRFGMDPCGNQMRCAGWRRAKPCQPFFLLPPWSTSTTPRPPPSPPSPPSQTPPTPSQASATPTRTSRACPYKPTPSPTTAPSRPFVRLTSAQLALWLTHTSADPAQAPPAFAIPPVTQQQQQPPPPPSPTIPIISPTPRLAYSVFDQVLGFDADDLLDARDDRQSPPAPHHRVDPVPAIAAPPSSGQPPALARRKRPLYDDEPPLPLDDSPRKRPRVSIPAAPSYSVYTHQHQQYSHTAAALPREAPRRARHTALTYCAPPLSLSDRVAMTNVARAPAAAPPQSYHYAAPHRPAPHRYAQHIAPRQPAR